MSYKKSDSRSLAKGYTTRKIDPFTNEEQTKLIKFIMDQIGEEDDTLLIETTMVTRLVASFDSRRFSSEYEAVRLFGLHVVPVNKMIPPVVIKAERVFDTPETLSVSSS